MSRSLRSNDPNITYKGSKTVEDMAKNPFGVGLGLTKSKNIKSNVERYGSVIAELL